MVIENPVIKFLITLYGCIFTEPNKFELLNSYLWTFEISLHYLKSTAFIILKFLIWLKIFSYLNFAFIFATKSSVMGKFTSYLVFLSESGKIYLNIVISPSSFIYITMQLVSLKGLKSNDSVFSSLFVNTSKEFSFNFKFIIAKFPTCLLFLWDSNGFSLLKRHPTIN